MNKIKLLIKSDDGAWEELKIEVARRVRQELSQEFHDTEDKDKVFAQVHQKIGLSLIIKLLEKIEQDIMRI
jgi:hypothetical protein